MELNNNCVFRRIYIEREHVHAVFREPIIAGLQCRGHAKVATNEEQRESLKSAKNCRWAPEDANGQGKSPPRNQPWAPARDAKAEGRERQKTATGRRETTPVGSTQAQRSKPLGATR